MHPLIEKFWKMQGYTISTSNYTYNLGGKILGGTIFLVSNENVCHPVAVKYVDDAIVYHIDHRTFSEKEALTLIKLKAFW